MKEFYGPQYLEYDNYPNYPELRCDNCTGGKRHEKESLSQYGTFKNGVKYDCNCDKISSPYSFPYESFTNTGKKGCHLHGQFPPFPPKPKINVMSAIGFKTNKLLFQQQLLSNFEHGIWILLILIVLSIILAIKS